MPFKVFVYGSLRRGESHHHLMGDAIFVGSAHTRAAYRLIDLGDYPGIVEGGSTAIDGEVFLVSATGRARLDAYEGHPGLFARRTAHLEDGSKVEMYLYVGPIPDGARELQHGDWRRR